MAALATKMKLSVIFLFPLLFLGIQPQDPGKPLFLTPYINTGRIIEGRKLARVANFFEGESYSGYLTVRENAHLFFWFFPAESNPEKSPVVLWHQGGPGGSSLFGLFAENGPYLVTKQGTLKSRPYSWTKTHSMVYIDSPVGTGFSNADANVFVSTTEAVAKDIYTALVQFFTLFVDYSLRDFYITGESYAGKTIPALASKIHRENQNRLEPKLLLNLKGIAVGDGLIDPVNNLQHSGELLYNIGLIDKRQVKMFQGMEAEIKRAIERNQWNKCFQVFNKLLEGYVTNSTLFVETTGYTNYYNFLYETMPDDQLLYLQLIPQPAVRRAIHVGNSNYAGLTNLDVYKKFNLDYCQSAVPWLTEILNALEGYRVLIYHGNLDVLLPVRGTENLLLELKWNGSKDYIKSPTRIWRLRNNSIAGYERKAKNLIFLKVRNAGHMVPTDQPVYAFDMINRFTSGEEFA